MKTRYHTIDIRALVKNLQSSILGMRVANIYDINPRTYLLKLAKPEHKAFLLIESGTRIHTTDYTRDKSEIPSVFSLKLRKHLRAKRLDNIQQVGFDRIVILTFGSGLSTEHLIVEMYAQGNIILADGDYNIQALLRTHKFDEDTVVAVNNKYPLHIAKVSVPMTLERLTQLISSAQKTESVKQVLLKSLDFGPELIEHCLLSTHVSLDTKVGSLDATTLPNLLKAVQLGESLFEQVAKENAKGYVVLKDNQPEGVTAFEEAAPMQYAQFADRKVQEYPTFNDAVDIFFSQLESQKADVQRNTAENAAKKKLDKFREEHSRRISSLHEAEITNERRARLIEANLTEVEQCLAVVRSALATGMDWNELSRLVKEEKKRNSGSVANIIHRLVLDKNMVTLLLSDPLDDEDDDEEDEEEEEDETDGGKAVSRHIPNVTRAPELVDVDIALSGYANACKYYEIKKQTVQKAQKTIDITEQALKAAERKSQKALKEAKTKQIIMAARKPFWFEKFYWFISSENYIIVCGRDMQQNEMLYKRYLEKDDLYVHADIHGASTCIIKNPSGGTVPPQTLAQAGVMCVCLSAAWQAKIVTSAWWVYANQVSKTAPTGEYLSTGSFMIRGKKNFLPPAQLVLGFGFMFRLDESSIPAHLGERSKLQVFELPVTEPTTATPTDAESVQSATDSTSDQAAEEESDEELDELEKQGVDITKYKLNVVADFEEADGEQPDVDDSASTASVGEGKKRLTASERRQMKRGKDPASAPTHPKSKPAPKPDPKPQSNSKEAPATVTQKGKKKGKLQELDEDEKAARAMLLGLGGKPKESKGKGKSKKGKEKDKTNAGGGSNGKSNNTKGGKPSDSKTTASTTENGENGSALVSSDKICFKCKEPGHLSAQCPQKEVLETDDPDVQKMIEEEDNAEEAQKTAERQTNLDMLTGQPRGEDVLLHAIPVLMPYGAMTHYKYKIKITPGHTKRGKAAKAAAEALFRNSEATQRERDLIRAVPLEELARSMIANIKLHATLAVRKAARDKAGKDLDFDILHEEENVK